MLKVSSTKKKTIKWTYIVSYPKLEHEDLAWFFFSGPSTAEVLMTQSYARKGDEHKLGSTWKDWRAWGVVVGHVHPMTGIWRARGHTHSAYMDGWMDWPSHTNKLTLTGWNWYNLFTLCCLTVLVRARWVELGWSRSFIHISLKLTLDPLECTSKDKPNKLLPSFYFYLTLHKFNARRIN